MSEKQFLLHYIEENNGRHSHVNTVYIERIILHYKKVLFQKDYFIKPMENLFIYIFLRLVGGGWSDWTIWNKCSRTCGNGKQTSKRYCNNPVPKYGGRKCYGNDERSRACNLKPCPGKYVYYFHKDAVRILRTYKFRQLPSFINGTNKVTDKTDININELKEQKTSARCLPSGVCVKMLDRFSISRLWRAANVKI